MTWKTAPTWKQEVPWKQSVLRKPVRIRIAAVVAATVIITALPSVTPAHAAGSSLTEGSVASAAVGGEIEYTIYLPDGYDPAGSERYPTLYLLHGRGDSMAAWQQEAGALDEMIESGVIPPMIVVMPDAPWSKRGNYYVDSQYTGSDPATTPGADVETAFTTDLIDHIDADYLTVDDRAARVIGGYSMGGAGALRYALAHQDLFAAGLVLSPAVYAPSTPVDSSTREFGAYGVGSELYDEARYQELSYPAALDGFDAEQGVHLFIAVGDDEYANPKPEDAIHDLDYEAATLYNRAKRVAGITAEMRVYNGGHDWDVWDTGFREGMADIAGYLRTTPAAPFDGAQFGSAGDDRAGGVFGRTDGSVIQAINAADSMLGHTGAGGFDIIVRETDSSGADGWQTVIATPLNDRAYGVVDGAQDAVIVGGFQRTAHTAGENDDALAVKIDAEGEVLWSTTLGSDSAADRAYGVASDGAGGVYLTGYTSGALPGATSAGDKDVLVAHIDADGAVDWAQQFGSPGEDKGFAAVASADGGVYVAGTAGGALPGLTSAGGYDGWVGKFAADGTREWLAPVGSAETDQVSALVATDNGVAAAGFAGAAISTGAGDATSAGDKDAFVASFDDDGSETWMTQYGTSGDDRAAALTRDAAGRLFAVGHTSGALAGGSGGVDVFTSTLSPSGEIVEHTQFGSAQRDGADEYDEASLYIAGGGSTWIQGITYGAVDGATNAGAADVFLAKSEFDGIVVAAVAPGGGTPGGGGNGGVTPPAVDPAEVPGIGIGGLVITGVDALRAAGVALLLLLAGGGLLVLRRFAQHRISRQHSGH